MPWQEESTMELRRQFIQDVQSGATPVSELCAAYQISRKTGYKWLARYEAGHPPRASCSACCASSSRARLGPRAAHSPCLSSALVSVRLRGACAGPVIPAAPNPPWTRLMRCGP